MYIAYDMYPYVFYVRCFNGVLYYVDTASGCTCRYLIRGKAPKVPAYKFEVFHDLLDMTNKERQELMKKTYEEKIKTEVSDWLSALGAQGPTVKACVPQVTASQRKGWTDLVIVEEHSIQLVSLPEKENTMNYDCNDQDTNARDYLSSRLHSIQNDKIGEMNHFFGLVGDVRPQTAKELIERITTGKYIVQPDKMEKSAYSPVDYFCWRDPSVKEDMAGMKAARKLLDVASIEVTDAIVIKTPTEALAALKDFEGKTFH